MRPPCLSLESVRTARLWGRVRRPIRVSPAELDSQSRRLVRSARFDRFVGPVALTQTVGFHDQLPKSRLSAGGQGSRGVGVGEGRPHRVDNPLEIALRHAAS